MKISHLSRQAIFSALFLLHIDSILAILAPKNSRLLMYA
jgi:hypothetical protein